MKQELWNEVIQILVASFPTILCRMLLASWLQDGCFTSRHHIHISEKKEMDEKKEEGKEWERRERRR